MRQHGAAIASITTPHKYWCDAFRQAEQTASGGRHRVHRLAAWRSAHIRLHQTVPAVEGGATAVRPAMLSLRAGQLLLFLTRRLASMVSWALGL